MSCFPPPFQWTRYISGNAWISLLLASVARGFEIDQETALLPSVSRRLWKALLMAARFELRVALETGIDCAELAYSRFSKE